MIHYYRNAAGHTVEIGKPEQDIWVDVTPPFDQIEFSRLTSELRIPADFLSDTLDIDERTRYEQEDQVKLIVIKRPTENKTFNQTDAYYVTIPISIILTHNHIITVNSFDNDTNQRFLDSFKNRQPEKRNLMALKILEKVVIAYMDSLKEINKRRNLVEKKLYDSNRNEELLQLMRIQKSLVYFVTALRGLEMLMMKIERTNFLGLNEEEKEFLDDLIVDTSQALEMANIYANILTSTLDAFASIISNNLNNVMKRLTSITIILSLPALVVGFYGMNVELPLQNIRHAYYFPLFLSLLISIVISGYFMKKKWF